MAVGVSILFSQIVRESKFHRLYAPRRNGLWGSKIGAEDNNLVIAETVIDASSYFALKNPQGVRYVSTAGSLNPNQLALIWSAMNNSRHEASLFSLDNDNGGLQLAATISTIFGQIDAGGCILKFDLPATPGQA